MKSLACAKRGYSIINHTPMFLAYLAARTNSLQTNWLRGRCVQVAITKTINFQGVFYKGNTKHCTCFTRTKETHTKLEELKIDLGILSHNLQSCQFAKPLLKLTVVFLFKPFPPKFFGQIFQNNKEKQNDG